MKRRATLVGVALVLGCVSAADGSHTFAGKPGLIAFARFSEEAPGIFSVRKDGTEIRRLTRASDGPLAWSPDGRQIAFLRSVAKTGTSRILVMNADGSDKRRVGTPSKGYAEGCGLQPPKWSYDGLWIAYADDCFDQTPRVAQIRLAAVDGSVSVGLTDYASLNHLSDQPWSPSLEGEPRLTFTSDRDGDNEVMTMAPDGSDVRQLTNDEVDQFEPIWSPDGSAIAFSTQTVSASDEAENSIYAISPSGGDPTLLAQGDPHAVDALWSPDGNRLLFNRRTQFGEPTAAIIDSDGNNEKSLAGLDATDAAWAPNSASIIFVKDGDLVRISDEGNLIKRLTRSRAYDFGPSWQTRGK